MKNTVASFSTLLFIIGKLRANGSKIYIYKHFVEMVYNKYLWAVHFSEGPNMECLFCIFNYTLIFVTPHHLDNLVDEIFLYQNISMEQT